MIQQEKIGIRMAAHSKGYWILETYPDIILYTEADDRICYVAQSWEMMREHISKLGEQNEG